MEGIDPGVHKAWKLGRTTKRGPVLGKKWPR